MDNPFELSERKHYKAVSHPLRLKILELLAEEACTNEELSRRLGVASGKLYFHTKTLLDAGMIVLVETRSKGHLTEKLYRAVAREWVAARPDSDRAPLEPLLRSALDLYRATCEESTPSATGGHLVLFHTPERKAQFEALFRDLFRTFRTTAVSPDTPNATSVALSFLLHDIPSEETK